MQKKKIQYNRSNITKEKEKFFYVNFKIYFGSWSHKNILFYSTFSSENLLQKYSVASLKNP